MSTQSRDRAEFRPSRVKPFFGFLITLPFVAGLVFVLVNGGPETWKDAAVLGLGLLFFGGCMVFFAWATLVSGPPFIVVDDAGLRLAGATAETIPWTAIAQMAVFKVGRYKGLGLLLHEPQRYLKSDGFWRGLLNRLNRAQGYHISITTTGLNGSQEDIVRAIQRFSGHRFPA